MRDSAIDKLDFLDPILDGSDRAVDFRNHPLLNHAGLFEAIHLTDLQVRDDRGRVFRVAQQARHITHEDQPFGLEGDGGLDGGDYICLRAPAIGIQNPQADQVDVRRDALERARELGSRGVASGAAAAW